MKRRLLNIVFVISMLPPVAVAAMWLRSHRVYDAVGYGAKFARGGDGAYMIRFVAVSSSRGIVYFGAGRFLEIYLRASGVREGLYTEHDARASGSGEWGFRYDHLDTGGGGFVVRAVGIPYWFVMLMSASACALMAWRWRRRRARTGSCARCGYDLRGSSDRCPECGAPFSPHAGRVATAARRAES